MAYGFQILGFKAYHMVMGVFDNPGQIDLWVGYIDALENGDDARTKAAANRLIDSWLELGFDSTTDYPACMLYKELMQRFPDAKVVLSVRENGQKWAQSITETIGRPYSIFARFPYNLSSWAQKHRKLHKYFWERTPGIIINADGSLDPNSLEQAHDLWKAQVIADVPKGRLLVHEAKHGWEPLCKHLGLPIPKESYPFVNETADMKKKIDNLERVANLSLYTTAAVGIGALSLLANYMKPSL